MSSRLTGNLIDCDGEDAYPMAGYSDFVVHMKQFGNCSVAVCAKTLQDRSTRILGGRNCSDSYREGPHR